jgi:preprotein translocase subunit SecE
MSRNRKRRGNSRPSDADPSGSGVRTARPQRDDRDGRIGSRVDDTSDPLGHSAPDAELAEAQLAAGQAHAEQPEQPESLGERAAEAYEELGGAATIMPGVTGPAAEVVPGEGGKVFADEREGEQEGEEPEHASHPAKRRNGLIGFAQGSWRELQRVQWPDQRQVVQATGVVIGFVIVAGAYLGVADWVATKLVNFILS